MMQELIDKLIEWQDNIACDIKADHITISEFNEAISQMAALSQAIGLLQRIGSNSNIPA